MKRVIKVIFGICFIAIVHCMLTACGGGGGGNGGTAQPLVFGEVDSFQGGNSSTASIHVQDSASGNQITDAAVSVNGIVLAYNAQDRAYRGKVNVAPGDSVVLNVTTGGRTYSATGTQFSSFPKISSPLTNDTWESGMNNTVNWSGETPTTDSFYGIGVVNNDSGQLDWPSNNSLQIFQSYTGSYQIPANVLTAGNRSVAIAVAKELPIAGAASGSGLIISAFDLVPVTIVNDPGINWSLSTPDVRSYLRGLTWAGNKFVAVGYSWETGHGSISTSSDGTIWATQNLPDSVSSLLGVVWSGNQLVAVGTNGTILTSPDAVIWTARTSNTSADLNRVAWSGALFVAVGASGTIVTSPDGITWTQSPTGSVQILSGIVWSGTKFVAVGSTGTILTSPDGITWTPQVSGTSYYLHSVSWSGSKFVAVGGQVLDSPDGITWRVQTYNNLYGLGLLDVVWSGTNFIAVGSGGNIFSSRDGVTWLYRGFTSADLYAVAWSGTRFVSTGYYYGTAIVSSQ